MNAPLSREIIADREVRRYVVTEDIRKVIVGRELDVLSRLGIEPPQRGHIDCPYPTHGGKSDWRWDFGKSLAYCTCSKGDSIFDVVMKCCAVDFEEAKLEVAGIIGRGDLIKEFPATRHAIKSDADSLLNPPADQRDDSLPRSYLASRLGVDVGRVVMPDTRVVGWKSLPYYDPPANNADGGKPTLVGSYPCTVWGAIDQSGATHALRIYVAAEGQGKANIPCFSDGRERDVKKAARRKDGTNVSGRAVLWGSVEAPWTIVCEGVETGAALSLAFRKEIETGDVLVAAALSANGVEAFRPWPACERVTVAADRDEATRSGGRQGSRRGERAAGNFASRNAGMPVSIALPGEPGTSTDWLDVLHSHGEDVVREGILSAPRLEAVRASSESSQSGDLARLDEISARYPLPRLENTVVRYALTPAKRVRVHKEILIKDGEVTAIPVATPFGVTARLRFVDSANCYGLRIVVEDMEGKPRNIDIHRDTLASTRCVDALAQLFGAGLRVEQDGERIVLACLKAADPLNEISVVRRAGWHTLSDLPGAFFVCPDGEVIGAVDQPPIELASSARLVDTVARSGSLEVWKRAVAAALSVEGCEHWALGIFAGFAGTLVSLAGLDTCGINISGRTSAGKTTAQRLAASIWSRPDATVEGLFQSAKSTMNGLEASAARANGTVFVLDELGHVSGRDLGKIVYMLAGGVGKKRLTSDAVARQSYNWSTFAFLSAERSLAEIIRTDGGEITPGMALRIVDIDVTDVNRNVPREIFSEIDAITTNYGVAGAEFARYLVSQFFFRRPEAVRKVIVDCAETIAGKDADGALKRAALPFALLRIAGLTARQAGLLPVEYDVEQAIAWGWQRFRHSAEADTLDTDAYAIEKLREWILEGWDSSLQNIRSTNFRDAYGWYDETYVYIPARRLSEAAGNTLKEREIAAALDKQNHIAKRKDQDCRFVHYVPRLGKLKAYVLRRGEFGRAPDRA